MTEPIIVAHAEPGLLAHFPDIVKLADGRLLATWREGPGHVDSDGRIRVTDSADGGLTWSEPRTAADGPFDDRDPKLAVLADGTVLLSFFVLEWGTRPRHTSHGTYVCRSTDGGRTWSEPAAVGDPRWAVSHGAAVQLADGDVLLPLYGRPNRDVRERAVIVRSDDGGRTWAAGEAVEIADDGVDLQEPTLIVLGDEVVALIRTTAGHAYLARSSDGGREWSVPQPTDMPASSHHALVLGSGEVLVTYGDLEPRFSSHRDTVGRLVTRPEGSWDGYPDIHLYDSGHPDQANPSSAEVAPGRFLTLGFDVPKATVIGVFTEAGDYRK
ncbi:sialidase family protein [Actinoplanes utahensis]|uniref:sialidase family protein n=1 Tax=Actinoplanes utahensis TaxID=1869 RepID=UPI00137773FE|nr:sialidase family protein [Actinoplanes utahensis]